MSSDRWVISLLLFVIVPVLLVRAGSAIGSAALEEWATAHGLELTAANRPVIARYLRRARVLRTWGAIVGLFVPTVADLVVSGRFEVMGFAAHDTAPFQGPLSIFVGYLIGALCAELSVVRRVEPAKRSASLVPRALADYLPRRLVVAQRAVGVVVVLSVLAIGVVPLESSGSQPTWVGLLAGAATFGGFAIALEALERWLVRRPQPFTDPDLVAVDDAIRAQSVHALAGSGLALLLMAVCGVLVVLAVSGSPALGWTMGPLAGIAFVLSIGACQDVSRRPWRVSRPVAHSTGPART